MNKGKLDDAKRRALNILDAWNDATDAVRKNSGYYYELQGVVEDAVECGAQAASGVHETLAGEPGYEESAVVGHVLDSGYQIVCSVTGLMFRNLVDWLAEQVGYTFENGDKITAIELFEVIPRGPYHDCIAVCRVERPYPEDEEHDSESAN